MHFRTKVTCLIFCLLSFQFLNAQERERPQRDKKAHREMVKTLPAVQQLGSSPFYSLEVTQAEYQPLQNPIQLNDPDEFWIDPEYDVDLDFNFRAFLSTFNFVWVTRHGIEFQKTDNDTLNWVDGYFANLADRGQGASESPISYEIEGRGGSRIAKFEWSNIGFDFQLEEEGVLDDFTNFQIWLYEADNSIEVRIGPTQVNSDFSFGQEPGPEIGLHAEYFISLDEVNIIATQYLSGDPAAPNLVDDFDVLNGVPDSGTVYRFELDETVSRADAQQAVWQVFPNPAQESIQIKALDLAVNVQSIRILDMNGKVHWTKEAMNADNAVMEIDIQSLPAGLYLIQIQTDQSQSVQKFIKN